MSFQTDTRAQNYQIGVIILLAAVIISVTFVGALGYTQIEQAAQAISVSAAENELERISAEITTVAFSDSQPRTIDMKVDNSGQGDRFRVRPDAGQITVYVEEGPPWDTPVYQANLGKVEYVGDKEQVALQGGGIWRAKNGTKQEIVQSPSIAVENRSVLTVNYPIILIRGDDTLNNRVRISKQSSSQVYSDVYVNDPSAVRVEIESEYSQAWARYYNSTLPSSATVTHSHENNRVTLTYGTGSQFYVHFNQFTMQIDSG